MQIPLFFFLSRDYTLPKIYDNSSANFRVILQQKPEKVIPDHK